MSAAEEKILSMIEEKLGPALAEQVEDMRKRAVDQIDKEVTTQVKARLAGIDREGLEGKTVVNDDGDVEHYPNGISTRYMTYMMRAAADANTIGRGGAGFLDHAKRLAEAEGNHVTAKALGTSVLGSGGALVPTQYSSEIIDALQPRAVVQQSGAQVMPLRGSMSIPFMNSSALSEYVDENAAATVSEPTTGNLNFTEHKVRTIVPVSTDLLRIGGPAAERAVRTNMLRSMAARRDLAMLRGDDANGSPKGLLSWAQTVENANGTVNVANITGDATDLMAAVEDEDVLLDQMRWYVAPRTFWYLRGLRTANGEYAFPELQMMDGLPQGARGYFMGAPVYVSTQIPTNLDTSETAGNDETDVLFVGHAEDLIIAQGEEMRIEVFPGGTYNDGASSVSGITRDQTVMAITDTHDFAPQFRGNEVGVLRQVTWGA